MVSSFFKRALGMDRKKKYKEKRSLNRGATTNGKTELGYSE
jgi:hypothetical protein